MLSYLTKDATSDLANKTKVGQAHWGGTGPEGKCCFECASWTPDGYSPERDEEGHLEPRRCRKFKQLTMGVGSSAVPAEALSCKYFEPAKKVWPLIGGQKALKEKEPAA